MRRLINSYSYKFFVFQVLLTVVFALTLIFLITIIIKTAGSFSYNDKAPVQPASVEPASYHNPPERMYGVTIDAVSGLNNIVSTLDRHEKRLTTRIVFDEWQPASEYTTAVNRIDTVSDIMGEILDSYYVKDYSIQQYIERTNEYLEAFQNKVDIWEVGNEVNGEWLGHKDSVVKKILFSFTAVKKFGKVTAVTLYYNKNCWENPQNEMFRWVNENMPNKMKQALDYVFVSYYEDDCNNLQPNWQQVFDSLHVIFPNSKLGIGECGTTRLNKKAEYMTRYYTMNVTTPNYVGGYFWWYYKQDCVPWSTKPLWQTLENAINSNNETQLIRDGDGY